MKIKLLGNLIEEQGELQLPLANFRKGRDRPLYNSTSNYENFILKILMRSLVAKFLRSGDTLAIAEGIVRFIEYEQHEFESLVRTMPTSALEPLSYEISLDGPMITIYLGLNLTRFGRGSN